MEKTRTCIACGKEYKYCPSCNKTEPKWKVLYDTEECKEMFDAISAYNLHTGNKEGIQRILTKYHVKDYSKYVESINKKLVELFPKKEEQPKQVFRAFEKPKADALKVDVDSEVIE